MDFKEYQSETSRTAAGMDPRILGLGLAGEVGEVLEPIKKFYDRGRKIDVEKATEELGDVLWYLSALALSMGVGLDEVATKNIEKLKARYPDGWKREDQ